MIIDTNGQNNFKTITDNFIINEENNNYVENKNENLNEKSDHDILQIKPLEKKLSAFILKSPISDNLGNLSDKKYLDDLNYIVRTKFKNNISLSPSAQPPSQAFTNTPVSLGQTEAHVKVIVKGVELEPVVIGLLLIILIK